ncbi:TPA: hypothetical protein ACXK4S_000689 [Pseudomonas aeruginosa]
MNLYQQIKKQLDKNDVIGIILRKRVLAGDYDEYINSLEKRESEEIRMKATNDLRLVGELKYGRNELEEDDSDEESSGGIGKKLKM